MRTVGKAACGLVVWWRHAKTQSPKILHLTHSPPFSLHCRRFIMLTLPRMKVFPSFCQKTHLSHPRQPTTAPGAYFMGYPLFLFTTPRLFTSLWPPDVVVVNDTTKLIMITSQYGMPYYRELHLAWSWWLQDRVACYLEPGCRTKRTAAQLAHQVAYFMSDTTP